MAKAGNIRVDELRLLANFFFDFLEYKMELDTIEITEDFYWSTLSPEKYNLDKQPDKLGVGQLSEDLYFLNEILKNKELAVAPNLIHFSALLDFICHNVHFKNRNIEP
jgi:hypothetical protein